MKYKKTALQLQLPNFGPFICQKNRKWHIVLDIFRKKYCTKENLAVYAVIFFRIIFLSCCQNN